MYPNKRSRSNSGQPHRGGRSGAGGRGRFFQPGGRGRFFQPPYPSHVGPSGNVHDAEIGDTAQRPQPMPPSPPARAATAAQEDRDMNHVEGKREIIPFWEDDKLLEKMFEELNVDRNILQYRATIFPSDYGDRVSFAMEATVDAHKIQSARNEESDYDDSSEASSVLDDRIGSPQALSSTHNSQGDMMCKVLVEALSQCPSMNLGFHVLPLSPEDDKACRCPLSKILQGWRDRWGLYLPQCRSSDAVNPVYTPNAFVAHLKAKKGCKYHDIIYTFMVNLYRDYVLQGMLHRAFYCVGDNNYKTVVSAEQRQNFRFTEAMKKELAAAKLEAAKAAERQRMLKKLAEVNKGLFEKLTQAEKKEKFLEELLGVRDSEHKTVTKSELEMFCTMYERERMLWDTIEKMEQLKIGCEKKDRQMVISVDRGFKLNAVFKIWDSRCMKGESNGTHEHCLFCSDLLEHAGSLSFFNKWKVAFYEKDNESYGIDEDGLTRQFLSEIFMQLSDLSLPTKNKKRGVLFSGRDFLLPLPDCSIDNQFEDKEKPRRYYRAIGRIMAYCVIHNFPISEQVLSPIHRAYLLQNLCPTSEAYSLHRLAREFGMILDNKKDPVDEAKDKDPFDEVRKALGSERDFRQNLYDVYIDGMSFALDALREGITLEGQLAVDSSFAKFPGEALEYCLFAKQEIKLEDLVKVLRPDYSEMDSVETTQKIQSQVLTWIESKKEAEGVFVDVLRDLENEHPGFIRDFVFFVTGLKFLPCREDFRINVEFSAPAELLPVAHTCDLVLVLPQRAYEGKHDVLKKQLEISMSFVPDGSFQME